MFSWFRRRRDDQPPEGAIRKLGFNEDGCVAVGEYVSFPVTFAVFLRSKIEITYELMLKSLKAVSRKHPLMRVKVIKNEAGSRYYVPIDNWEEAIRLRMRGKTDWREVVAENGDVQIDAAKGPLWFADLVQVESLEKEEDDDRETFVLVVVFNHAILDGKSGVFIMNDIVQNLNWAADGNGTQDEPDVLPIVPCMEETVPPEIQLSVMDYFRMLYTILKMLKSGSNEYMKLFPARIQREPQVNIGTHFMDITVPMAPLLERCRAEKVTMQGAVTSAAYIALLKVIRAKDPDITKIKMASNYIVDYRRFCNPIMVPEFMGFYAMAAILEPVEVARTEGSDFQNYFWSIARRVTNEIHGYIADPAKPIKMLRLAAKLISYDSWGQKMPQQKARGERATDAFGVSNIGNVDPILTAGQSGSSVEVTKILWGTNGANMCPPFMHFLMSMRGQLVWTLNWFSNVSTKEEAEFYAEKIKETLNDAVN